MTKPVWFLIACFMVVPGSVWAESLDQTQQPIGETSATEADRGGAEIRRTAVSHDEGHGLEYEGAMSIQIPKLRVQGFLDVGFNALSADDRRETSFAMGQLDLLVSSELNDKAYFLAEAFFSNPENNTQAFMLARANIRYSISSLVDLRIGQMHTAIGYWNSFYHHGSFIQTTVSRPEILRNDRAYLPIHSVGVELFGTLEGRAFDITYTLGVFNGRGMAPPAVVRVKDDNDAKGITALINLSPRAVDGLTLGATLYLDTIPPNPSLTTRTKSIGERIIGGHLVSKTNRVELLGELFNIYHDDHTSDQGYDTAGWYA